MKCRFCHADNREEAKFCSYCGKSLAHQCPVCGAVHPSVFRFCDRCGARLIQPQGRGEQELDREGERKLVSVLFADTAGFTSMAEVLDPEEVAQIVQQCLPVLTQEVERYGGRVTQFTGDGIMALFGAPSADEDHAKRACLAGISIQQAILPFSERILREYGSPFRMRIGINSGMVVVGSVDSGYGTEYTALGDTINIASRIESLSPPGSVCCSGDTFRLARDFFHFKAMGSTKVKGKARPVELYRVLEVGQIESRMGAAVARGLTPFVGRERELRELVDAFRLASLGKGQAVSLVGEAGVGKSRLLFEFRRAVQEREFDFLLGECLPFGVSIAYLPFLGLVRSYLNLDDDAGAVATEGRIRSRLSSCPACIPTLLPPLCDVLSIPYHDYQYESLTPKQKRDRIFESLSRLLIDGSKEKCLVIAMESVMWIDRTSEEFVQFLIDLLPESRILLLLLYRPGYMSPGQDSPALRHMTIERLPDDDAPLLIKSLLHGPASHELQHLLLTTSGGNPLFIEELTNSLFEKGYVRKTENGYALNLVSFDLPIPATIHGIIAARIDHLQEQVKKTLQFAAVIGKHFSGTILGRVMGAAVDLPVLLRDLQELDLIYEEGGEGQSEYRFKHDLVQEVAYNSLLLRKRKDIHQTVAEAIEALNPDNIDAVNDILAYHYSKSNNNRKAYMYLKQSGGRSTRNSSLWEAFRFYRQALDFAPDKGITSQLEGLEIRLQMASAMISLGFPEDSLDILKQAEVLSRSLNDKKSLTGILSMIGLFYSVRGDTLRGIRYARACLSTARETGDVDLVAPIVFDLCSNYAARGEFSQVTDIAPAALSLLKETGKERETFSRGYNIYTAILAFYAFSLGFMGRFERALALLKEGLERATDLDNLYSIGLNEILSGYVCCQKGDGSEALAHFERSIEYLERGQIFVLLGLAWNGVGRARYFLGDLQEALSCAEKGLKIHSDSGVTYNLSAHFWFLALVFFELGRMTEAQEKLEESLRLARKNREYYYVALARLLKGRIGVKTGAMTPEQAERSIKQATAMLRRQRVEPQAAIGYLCMAELDLRMGQPKKMVRNLTRASHLFSGMKMTYWTARAERLKTLASA